jgi:hypothetical protein
MSIELVDSEGRSLPVSVWHWGLLHSTVECARPPLFTDAGFLDQLRLGGADLAADQVNELREYLETVVLPRIGPGCRMLHDLSVTDQPDDGTLFREPRERNYSLPHEALVSVVEFLRHARAPVGVR